MRCDEKGLGSFGRKEGRRRLAFFSQEKGERRGEKACLLLFCSFFLVDKREDFYCGVWIISVRQRRGELPFCKRKKGWGAEYFFLIFLSVYPLMFR